MQSSCFVFPYFLLQFPVHTHKAIVETTTALKKGQRYSSRFSPKLANEIQRNRQFSAPATERTSTWTQCAHRQHLTTAVGERYHLVSVTEYTRPHKAFLPCLRSIPGKGSAASRGETACLSEIRRAREAELDSTRPQAIVTNRKAEQASCCACPPL